MPPTPRSPRAPSSQFFASWCYKCKAVLPELVREAAAAPRLRWALVDHDENEVRCACCAAGRLEASSPRSGRARGGAASRQARGRRKENTWYQCPPMHLFPHMQALAKGLGVDGLPYVMLFRRSDGWLARFPLTVSRMPLLQ